MRKAVFWFFLLLGVAAGVFATLHDGWGLRMILMVIGGVVGGVIGAVLSQFGKPVRRNPFPLRTEMEVDPLPGGLGMSGRDVQANFWRDEGHPPFMKPPKPELGDRMLDADKWT